VNSCWTLTGATRATVMASRLPGLRIPGGCCGPDACQVAALWGV
jgi:hypothetical protein